MLRLVIKDILIQKKTFIGALIYLIFVIFAFQGLEGNAYTAAIVAFSYLMVMGAFGHDDKNKSDIMLNSLPIKRKNIVMAKYISLFAYITIGTLAFIAVNSLVSVSNINIKTYPVTLESIISAIFAISLLNSISFPLMFKLGFTKSRVFNMILFLSIFFAAPYVVKFFSKPESAFAVKIINFLKNQSDIAIVSGLLASFFIILLISYLISVKMYKGREF